MVVLTEQIEIPASYEKMEAWTANFEEEFVKWSPYHIECNLYNGNYHAGSKVRFREIVMGLDYDVTGTITECEQDEKHFRIVFQSDKKTAFITFEGKRTETGCHSSHTEAFGMTMPVIGAIAVLCHLTVHEDAGKAHQKIPQGSGNTDCQNAGGNLFLHGKVLEADAEGRRAFQEVDNVISRAHHISDDGGNGCTGNVPAEHKNHNGVKNDIQEISQKLPHHRLAGLPLGADDVGVAVGNQDKRAGAAHDRQIGFCIVPGFRACADHGENLIHEDQEQRRHQHPDGNTAPHTERADLFA